MSLTKLSLVSWYVCFMFYSLRVDQIQVHLKFKKFPEIRDEAFKTIYPCLLSLKLEHSALWGRSLAYSCFVPFWPWPWWPPPRLLHPHHQSTPPPAADPPWSLSCPHLWRADPNGTWCEMYQRTGSCFAAASQRCCLLRLRLNSSHPCSHVAQSGTAEEPHGHRAPSVTPTSWTCNKRNSEILNVHFSQYFQIIHLQPLTELPGNEKRPPFTSFAWFTLQKVCAKTALFFPGD